MKGYIGVTSYSWWNYIKDKNIKKINFWNTMKSFNVLKKGDVLFFLKKNEAFESGERFVVGCAFFEEFKRMSAEEAWNEYKQGNGFEKYDEFTTAYSSMFEGKSLDEIGCIILSNYIPFETPLRLSDYGIEFQHAIVSGKSISIEETNKLIINAGINYWAFGQYYLKNLVELVGARKNVDGDRLSNELRNRSREYQEAGIISVDLYSISSSAQYEPLKAAILNSDRYREFKERRKEASPDSGLIADQALNRYSAYLKFMEGSNEPISSDDPQTEDENNNDSENSNGIQYTINLGIGRVQNVTAVNVFTKPKSLYEFIQSAQGKKYSELKAYCNEYYGKGTDGKYFGQIITPINLLGLIEVDEDEQLIKNDLLSYIWSHKDILPSLYMRYFLCVWQYPLPSTDKNYGRELRVFKPYCLLLKILIELNKFDENEAYLTETDFESIFLRINDDLPRIEDINEAYVLDIVQNRASRRIAGVGQENGSLTYIINTLVESDILTKDNSLYNNAEGFYIGLKRNSYYLQMADFIIRNYSDEYYKFAVHDAAGKRDEMSKYGKYINNLSSFITWRGCYMNITRIGEFKDYCQKRGFNYSEDLIRRFVLSLETKPFLLLTGISGSGKTKIAELWTSFLIERGEAEGIQIAVGSNWSDNKKLLGFKNVLLDESESYQPTELVKIMRAAENSEKEYIVILDEMNLSRVEMYFADFLSALESMNHVIKLPDGSSVRWGKNLKVIGTVNVDESTYMFSPKVLDRANVIEMNGVSPKEYIESVKDSDAKIYKSIISEDWFDDYVETLESVYTSLNGEFAYRVMDEMSLYIATNVKLYGSERITGFIDEQICQKVLPKLHGSKAQLKPKLDKLETVFGGKNYPLINSKLAEMQEDIKKGYTSFIGD